MSKAKYYIASFRLRTLPLSLSGIFLGTLLADANGNFSFTPFLLAVATTLCLQILSNLANELGDIQKGTDNNERLGPIRSIQSGALSLQAFKNTIIIFIVLSAIFGTCLIYTAFDSLLSHDGLIMLILGAAAIIAAIKYTVGKGAYGYHGLGDLFVFLFFGLLSVMGAYFLMTHHILPAIFLPAAAIGFLSTGVLNLNNMRDIENDRHCNKKTLPVLIGISTAKKYHFALIAAAFICMGIYSMLPSFLQFQFSIDFAPVCFSFEAGRPQSRKSIRRTAKNLVLIYITIRPIEWLWNVIILALVSSQHTDWQSQNSISAGLIVRIHTFPKYPGNSVPVEI